jgi:hypothetical protein
VFNFQGTFPKVPGSMAELFASDTGTKQGSALEADLDPLARPSRNDRFCAMRSSTAPSARATRILALQSAR